MKTEKDIKIESVPRIFGNDYSHIENNHTGGPIGEMFTSYCGLTLKSQGYIRNGIPFNVCPVCLQMSGMLNE